MGKYLTDQYTLLHFAVGVIFYFFGISFIHFVIIHTIFEIVENTKIGIHIINTYFVFWPGGKPQANHIINRVGDTFGAILGWVFAKYLDIYYKKNA